MILRQRRAVVGTVLISGDLQLEFRERLTCMFAPRLQDMAHLGYKGEGLLWNGTYRVCYRK